MTNKTNGLKQFPNPANSEDKHIISKRNINDKNKK